MHKASPSRRMREPLILALLFLSFLSAALIVWHRLARMPKTVEVPAGELEMGAADGEPDEQPVHRVQVAAFDIDATEVTTEAYAACVRAGKCEAPSTFHANCNGTGPDVARHPVNCVTWKMADAFCRWRGARLPTEEEWEYAARGPRSQTYPWGNEASADKSCWNRPAGKPCTCAVGSHGSDTSPF